MTPSLINPYIRVAMRSVIPTGHHISRRIIYDYELIYLEQGEFTFIYNDTRYSCRAGDILFIRPGVAHSFQIDNGDISQPHIHFDLTYRIENDQIPVSFKDIDRMTDEEKTWIQKNYFISYPTTPFVKIQSKEMFLDIFYKVISEKNTLIQKAAMLQLLSILIEDNFPDFMEEETAPSIAHQIKNYIDAGNGLRMNLNDFSKNFFQSKFYLEKIFKRAFGMGIIEYRNKKRMALAPYLLKNNSVTEVAELLGYQSIFSFSRAYKQHYGHSPRNHISD